MAQYINLSEELQQRIQRDRAEGWQNPYACRDEDVIRRDGSHDRANLWRPAFVRDCEKILHIPYYNRYSDKTQVFSLYKNDDISRRAQHVQLVSRIARNIGSVLGLNLDLIEAISLGHDIGHTPFGHEGERILDDLYFSHTGRHFNHNIHSARVLDCIFPLNLSLQTLDGIICHNGELEQQEYTPRPYTDFTVLDEKMEACYLDPSANKKLVPSTLEACVMRVSDIIAYLGKDRQDAIRLNLIEDVSLFDGEDIGRTNAEIINNMTVNILENSYGKGYIQMDRAFYEAFSKGKKQNYSMIYRNEKVAGIFQDQIRPMMEQVYEKLLKDVREHNKDSYIYQHHMSYIEEMTRFYHRNVPYEECDSNDLVVDYIASMTDDYLIDLYGHMFPGHDYRIEYVGYFD
ncbi:MAG: HD domain-containing protein [Lachnospiraceae bacterium]|nr:HD domain-containing protein [Lachnospiraceae bacterium]